MFRKIARLYNYIKLKVDNDKSNSKKNIEKIPSEISILKNKLNEIFSVTNDFYSREMIVGQQPELKVMITFIDGLIDKAILNRDIIDSLINIKRLNESTNYLKVIKNRLINGCEIEEVDSLDMCINYLLSGDTILFIEGYNKAIKIGTRGWETRSVDEPQTEVVVRGPREGFVETLPTNMALLRRRVKNPNLKFERLVLGEQTKTDVLVCYIKGLAHDDIIKTVKRRLKRIKTDAILESGYIEEFIEDAPLSIFPTVGNSEKPDIVAAKLLEGRVAILCDGTPFVLTVPNLFIENFQISEDYYARFAYTFFIRIARLIAFFLATTLPAFYVSLISFHQDVIPFELLLRIAASNEGIPFPPVVEASVMIFLFELLREAGVRMPKPVGQAVSIVGALILGEAAVSAGVTSDLMVIIIGATAISSFILPSLRNVMPLLRILFLLVAPLLGFFGMMVIGVMVLAHLCSLRSFGVSYMAPFAPLVGVDLKDTFVRFPIWSMVTRPQSYPINNKEKYDIRMKKDYRTGED